MQQNSDTHARNLSAGFTLVEVLTVVAIIGILSAIVTTSLLSARSRARVTAGVAQDASMRNTVGNKELGEWLFTDCGGTTLKDSQGLNDGTLVGNPTWGSVGSGPGSTVCALTFDGSSQYVKVGPVTEGSSLTYAAWVKISALPSTSQALIWDDNNQAGWDSAVMIETNGTIRNVSNFADTIISSPTKPVKVGEWNFVVVTSDSTGSRVYINGILTGNSPTAITSRTDLSYISFAVGYDGGGIIGASTYFKGSLGGVRIYKTAITAAEVRTLYAAEAPHYKVAVR